MMAVRRMIELPHAVHVSNSVEARLARIPGFQGHRYLDRCGQPHSATPQTRVPEAEGNGGR